MEVKYIQLDVDHNNKQHYGDINVNLKVIEVIASNAAEEVDGVSLMHEKITKVVTDAFNRNHRKGVSAELVKNGIVIDVYIDVKYGASIHKVSSKVQENIKQAIFNMTLLEVSKVYVHVVNINF
ncbi:Asp23/Gls24 family envelope stress response protein [Haloplasma contractile]|uniref:Ral stress protein Gls24 family protein n=1 Tax=Haloplasma contractile SSD-17B TaxID=1033810 RepID=U2EFS6_9MOLU|nr:Asp23/Gls24 family envelope stress response protein [Haloplasma contractile]ERJ13778.1 ral stress protein Gls24 family protein [Haloplasma contractile SSD-17B]